MKLAAHKKLEHRAFGASPGISRRTTTIHLIETSDRHCDKIISVSHQSFPPPRFI
ncbi:hypothetical protein O5169_10100 [Escherichia coli]|nr:hypothetical protein [Escherichia coli]